jgi:nucleoside-diphosphate-sugar epimerase
MTSKLAITGASGQVGRLIVPYLVRTGIDLVLIGRDPIRLKALFPGHVVAGYNGLASAIQGCDAVLHLAVMNNDNSASRQEMHAVNVGFLLDIAAMARDVGVRTFINATTIHALDTRRIRSIFGRPRDREKSSSAR